GDRERPDFQSELAHRLGRHERHDPVRACLDLHLGGDGVDDDVRDQSGEAVAGAGAHTGGVCARFREGDRLLCESLAGDLRRGGVRHRQHSVLDPPADGVVADAEQISGLGDLETRGHARTLSPLVRIETRCSSAYADALAAHRGSTLWVCRSHRWSNPLTRSAAESTCARPDTSGWRDWAPRVNGASPPPAWA